MDIKLMRCKLKILLILSILLVAYTPLFAYWRSNAKPVQIQLRTSARANLNEAKRASPLPGSIYLLRASRDFKKYGYNPDYADDIVFRGALGGILGAKLYYLIENINNGADQNLYGLVNILYGIINLDSNLISMGIQNFGSGLVFLGGLIGGLLLISMYLKKKVLIYTSIYA